VTGDDDPVGMKVETSIPLMIGRITKEDTKGWTRRQFMWSGRREVRVTGTAKDTKMCICGMSAM
jgi:hypothetical protein